LLLVFRWFVVFDRSGGGVFFRRRFFRYGAFSKKAFWLKTSPPPFLAELQQTTIGPNFSDSFASHTTRRELFPPRRKKKPTATDERRRGWEASKSGGQRRVGALGLYILFLVAYKQTQHKDN
jgi:hypothetical protein